MAYACHFDAGKLAGLLRDVGKATGVKHVLGNVLAVNDRRRRDRLGDDPRACPIGPPAPIRALAA